jgi:hypothetical protein
LSSRMLSMRCMMPISAISHHWQMSCQRAVELSPGDVGDVSVRQLKRA